MDVNTALITGTILLFIAFGILLGCIFCISKISSKKLLEIHEQQEKNSGMLHTFLSDKESVRLYREKYDKLKNQYAKLEKSINLEDDEEDGDTQ